MWCTLACISANVLSDSVAKPCFFPVDSRHSSPHSYPRAFWVMLWIVFCFFAWSVLSYFKKVKGHISMCMNDSWHVAREPSPQFELRRQGREFLHHSFRDATLLTFCDSEGQLHCSWPMASKTVRSHSFWKSLVFCRFVCKSHFNFDWIWAENFPVIIIHHSEFGIQDSRTDKTGIPGLLTTITMTITDLVYDDMFSVQRLCIWHLRSTQNSFFGPCLALPFLNPNNMPGTKRHFKLWTSNQSDSIYKVMMLHCSWLPIPKCFF